MIDQIKRYLLKNFNIEKHYRFSFIAQILSLMITLVIFFFIDRFFYEKIKNYTDLNYFSYIFAGLIALNYSSGNSTVIQIVSFDVRSGVFEFISARKNFIIPYMVSAWVYSFIISTIEAALYIMTVSYTSTVKFDINIVSFAVIVIISSLTFCALSFISAGFIVLFKKGDIINIIVGIVEAVFGSVYFPSQILGDFSFISEFVPMKHCTQALRKVIYEGKWFYDIDEFFILSAFTVLSTLISVFVFKSSIRKARLYGNINQF